jgi:hypothetical protein
MPLLLALLLGQADTVERSEHYEVHTDGEAALARSVAARLESAFKAYGSMLAPAAPEKTAFKVRVFATKEKFDAFLNERKPRESYVYQHDTREVVACCPTSRWERASITRRSTSTSVRSSTSRRSG